MTIIDSLTWLRTMFVCCTSERSSLLTPLRGVDITASTESTESQRPAAENYISCSHYMLVTIVIIQKHVTKVTKSNNSKHHSHHKQSHTRLFTSLYVCHVITTNCEKLKILKLWWSIIAQRLCPRFNENPPTDSTAVHMHTHTYTHKHTHTQHGNLISLLTSVRKKHQAKNSVVGALMTKWQIKMHSVAKNVSSLITLGILGLPTVAYLVFLILRHFMDLSVGK